MAALGWLLGQHRFTLSLEARRPNAARASCSPAKLRGSSQSVRLAEATALVRDLVNTPAADLGPAELEEAVRESRYSAGAQVRVTAGKELAKGYPLIPPSAARRRPTARRA